MKKIGWYLRRLAWLWRNREWLNTRQKFRAMEKELSKNEKDFYVDL